MAILSKSIAFVPCSISRWVTRHKRGYLLRDVTLLLGNTHGLIRVSSLDYWREAPLMAATLASCMICLRPLPSAITIASVQVRIVEAGNYAASPKIDDLRLRPALEILGVIDSGYATVDNDHVLCLRVLWIEGGNASIVKDKIGGGFHSFFGVDGFTSIHDAKRTRCSSGSERCYPQSELSLRDLVM